jgi:hypothetical protein
MLVRVPSVQIVPIVPNVLNGLNSLNVLNSAEDRPSGKYSVGTFAEIVRVWLLIFTLKRRFANGWTRL